MPKLGLAEVALFERRWDEAMSLAREALKRTSPVDFAAKYETALILAPIPAARAKAVTLLKDAIEGVPSDPMSHMLLGELLELAGDADSLMYLQRARELWQAPIDFDEALRRDRESLRNIDREEN